MNHARVDPTPGLNSLPSGPPLLGLYEEWRRISQLESEAIDNTAWTQVDSLQNSKYQLQSSILEATRALYTEASEAHLHRGRLDDEIRNVIQDLMLMERRNADRLALKQRELEHRRAELDRASRNLRQVHRAYGTSRSPAWTSYS
ncbi:MAG: hypothetical protein FJ404_13875 [Verrucomicrobia bacterium]|nr:hypothetical protein [Verrucomicrobiota bacterium]